MNHTRRHLFIIIAGLLLVGSLGAQTAQAVCYVNVAATGANSGADWANAYTSLYSALANAACTEIWVARGVYYASPIIGFELKTGVAIYGGFAGTETLLAERDWEANTTILSGDIGKDDVNTDGNFIAETWADIVGTNAGSIVVADSVDATARLDGFTVTAGSHEWPYGGGGIYNVDASPSYANLVISGNQGGDLGGGIFNSESSPRFEHVLIRGNRAFNAYSNGGGMYSLYGGSPTLLHVTFDNNYAERDGGGFASDGGSPSLEDVTFSNNRTGDGYGGGINFMDGVNATLKDVRFIGNQSYMGGGLYIFRNGSLTMTDVVFRENTARDDATMNSGGGMAIAGDITVNAVNVSFIGNTAADCGGGVSIEASSLNLTNALFLGNRAVNRLGGGVGLLGGSTGSTVALTNATFSGNRAAVWTDGTPMGGAIGIELYSSGHVTATNSILWGNSPNEVYTGNSTFSSSYSNVQQASGVYPGTGNINSDPLFVTPVDAATAPTTIGDLRLQAGSPAINAGNNSALPADAYDLDGDGDAGELLPLDLSGQFRIASSVVDMGAYESDSNAAPVIAQGESVAVTLDEDGTPTAWSAPTISATDGDGDALTWSLSSGPAHGAATVSGAGASPTITYAPAAHWNGSDSFVAQVSDGKGGADTITVNVTVNPVNDAPVNTTAPAVSGTLSVGQTLTASDGAWNDDLDTTVSGVSTLLYTYQWQRADDASGTNAADIMGATGSTYTLTAADAHAFIRVNVTGTDNGVGAPATQSAMVSSAYAQITNSPPVIAEGAAVSVTMSEDGSPTAWSAPAISATDADGDTLTWSLNSGPANGAATVSGAGASPTITYAPTAHWNGSDSFVAQVSDGKGGADAITVNVTVNPVNDAPVNTTAPGVTGTPLVGNTLSANSGAWNDDLDTTVSGTSTLSYTYQWQRADDASGANLTDIAGATNASYTLTADDDGRYARVRVTATDTGVGLPASQSATADSAWALVGTAGFTLSKASVTVSEAGTTDTFTVVLTAPPGSNVVFTVTSSDAGEVTVSPATLTFTTADWNVAQTVTVTGVNDNVQDGSQTSLVTVSVNDALSDDAFDPLADKTVSVTTADNDIFQAGQWQDANKDGPDDDDLCWAAAASNLLYWGGWDAGLTSAQAVFDVFEDHWTNDISRMYEAWRWWLDGTVPGSRAPGSKVDVGGAGGYYQGEYSSAFFVSSMTGAADLLLDTLATALTNTFGVTLGLLKTASTDTHALTVWGYDLDAGGALLGLHVADSDDGLNQLQYLSVQYDAANSYWTLSSDPTWYIRELNALGTRGGATNAVFGGTGTMTGQRYGAGGVKNIDYSANGQTPVPEPGSLVLVGLGVLGLLSLIRRLRRR